MAVNDMGVGNLYGGTGANALGLTATQGNTPGYLPGVQEDTKYSTYLKLFSGELFKAYQNQTMARELCTRRTLRSGKSMQFIFTGNLEAYYHSPGKPIMGEKTEGGDANQMPVAEKTIVMDDLLVASTFVDNLDELLAHYDLRGEMARKIGYALANSYDKKIFKMMVQASRQPAAVTGQESGAEIEIGFANRVGESTHSAEMVKAFFAAAQRFDETNVPANGRVAVLRPQSYYNLITQVSNNVINRDEVGDALQGGNGVYSIAGIKILKSNNLPSDFEVATNGENNKYAGDYRSLQGIITHKDCVGVVESIGPSVQTTSGDVSIMYQGDLIVGRLAMGAGHLNVAGAISLVAGGSQDLNADGTKPEEVARSAATDIAASRVGNTSQNAHILV